MTNCRRSGASSRSSRSKTIYQALIEAELSSVIGALPHQRNDARTGYRNGYRARTLSSGAGNLELRIPKLRADAALGPLPGVRFARDEEQRRPRSARRYSGLTDRRCRGWGRKRSPMV